MSTPHIPAGYQPVIPYLICKDAARALDYYEKALGAEVVEKMEDPNSGKVAHAELKVEGCHIMLADEYPEMDFVGPETLGGAGVSLMVYVQDVDARYAQVMNVGGEELRPLQDQFYGDRTATFKDPFGHMWTLATHIEDAEPEELQRRAEQHMQEHMQGD